MNVPPPTNRPEKPAPHLFQGIRRGPIIHDPDLADVLMNASAEDLSLLIDVITNGGYDCVMQPWSDYWESTKAKRYDVNDASRAMIVEKLTRNGGHSLMNWCRGGSGVSYRDLLIGAIGQLGPAPKAHLSCAEMEMEMIANVFRKSLGRMSDEDRPALFKSVGADYHPGKGSAAQATWLASSGASKVAFSSLWFNAISAIASSVAGDLVERVATDAFAPGFAWLAKLLNWTITVVGIALFVVGPAYRVTVPSVILIGHMRQKLLLKHTCPDCQTVNTPNRNFCSKCGTRLKRLRKLPFSPPSGAYP